MLGRSLKCYKIAIGTCWKSVFLMGFWEWCLWTNAGKTSLVYNLGKVEVRKTCWSSPVSFDMSWVPWLQRFEICFAWLGEHAALGKACCKTQRSQSSWRVAQGVMRCRVALKGLIQPGSSWLGMFWDRPWRTHSVVSHEVVMRRSALLSRGQNQYNKPWIIHDIVKSHAFSKLWGSI